MYALSLLCAMFVPSDLPPGTKYHLAFLTQETTTGLSGDIDYYNSFVDTAAVAPGALTEEFDIEWKAIVSTEDVRAKDNAIIEGPVYLLDGSLVTKSWGHLWSGWLDHNINLTQFGVLTEGIIWTGTGKYGDRATDGQYMGGPQTSYVVGRNDLPLFDLVNGRRRAKSSWLRTGATYPEQLFHLYAVSATLHIPIPLAVPEPTTLSLLLVGTVFASVRVRSNRV